MVWIPPKIDDVIYEQPLRLTPHCRELKKGKLLLILKYKSWMRDFFRKSLPGKNTNLMRKVVVDDSNSDHLESQFRG